MAKVSVTIGGTDGTVSVSVEDNSRNIEELTPQLYVILHSLDPESFPVPEEDTN